MPLSKEYLALVESYNDTDAFPTLQDVAKHHGIALKTVKNRIGIIRAAVRAKPSELTLKLISRAVNPELPMSEDHLKFKADWGPGECLAHLRQIAEDHPEQVISRNFFRNHADCSESTWNRYFGTFEEFKRQAGVKLSRQVHKLEREIAKHASVDHYRALTDERLDWGARYERKDKKRYKTILTVSDLHDKEIDPFFLRVLIDTAKRLQPDYIVLGGDVFDLPEFGKYTVDPREWDVVGRIKFVHENILRPLREACPDAQIDLIEGNHEARLLRHLADQSPAMRTVLADLHGFTIGKLFGLEQFEVNYVAKGDLATWTARDFEREVANNYKIYEESFLVHHFPHARAMKLPGCNGHHHKHQVWPEFSPIYGAYEWHQLGAGHIRSASYCEGERWHNGLLIAHVDTHTHQTVMDYGQVTDFACVGGRYYYRAANEGYHGAIPSILQRAA